MRQQSDLSFYHLETKSLLRKKPLKSSDISRVVVKGVQMMQPRSEEELLSEETELTNRK